MNRQDNSTKSCNATYAPCDGAQQPQIAYNDTSESQLVLTLKLSDQTKYCYAVNASNNSVSVLIEGSITEIGEYISMVIRNFNDIICSLQSCLATSQSSSENVLQPGGIVGIVISILIMILILAVITIILQYIYCKSRNIGM